MKLVEGRTAFTPHRVSREMGCFKRGNRAPRIQCDWLHKAKSQVRCPHRAEFQTPTFATDGSLTMWRLCLPHRNLAMRDLTPICNGFGLVPTKWTKLKKLKLCQTSQSQHS